MSWKHLATASVVAAALAGERTQAQEKIVIDGSTTVGPVAKAFAEYYMQRNPGVTISVSESGSGNGAKSLINGTCQIATMSRAMKDNELAAAKEKGVEPLAHVVCMDGIALIVHPSNPVKGLTVEQVRAIYMGEITNWKELGGPDQPIVVISRDTNSGTYEAFEELVMKKEKMGEKTEYVGSNGAIRQRVLTTPAAIGYVGLAFLEGVKALAINGVEPTAETVTQGTYPVSRPLFMYTNGKPTGHVAAYIGLKDAEDGHRLIEDIGFVPLKVKAVGKE